MEHLTIKAGGEDEKHSERTTFKHQNLWKMEVSPSKDDEKWMARTDEIVSPSKILVSSSKNDEAWCFHHQNVWKTYVKLLNS
jgi:hypothetical protein